MPNSSLMTQKTKKVMGYVDEKIDLLLIEFGL